MTTFIAHYKSLDKSHNRAKGLFEFESDSRLSTKANMHDARVRMLEMFGNEALSWSIVRIERKRSVASQSDGQMELDFREPLKTPKRKTKKQYW